MNLPHGHDPDGDYQPGITVRPLYAEDLEDYLAFFRDEEPKEHAEAAPVAAPPTTTTPRSPASPPASSTSTRRPPASSLRTS